MSLLHMARSPFPGADYDVKCKDVLSLRFDAEETIAVGTPYRQYPRVPMISQESDIERIDVDHGEKWWPIKNAAYGSIVSTGTDN